MSIAATNEVAVRIIEEAVFGTTPATPAFKELRYTSESLIHNKDTVTSEVIRSDRQRDFLAEVAANAEGDVNAELAYGVELDTNIEGLLQDRVIVHDTGDGDTSGAPATFTSVIPPDATLTGGSITRPGGDWVADGFAEGDTITLVGFAGDDGDYKIQSVVPLTIVVEPAIGDAPMAGVAGGGDEVVTAPLNTIDVVAAARTFTRTAGDYAVDGFVVGQFVRTGGFTNPLNNGLFRIEIVGALVLTMEAGFGDVGTIADESGDADERIYGRSIENGTTAKSYTVVKEFADVAQFEVFRGLRFGQGVLTAEVGAIASMAWSLQGRGEVDMAATLAAISPTITGESVVEPDTTDQMNATSNVGQLFEGGAARATCLSSIALTMNNNLRNIPCIADKFPAEVNSGFIDVSGTVEAFFEDEVLFDKFVDHTQSSLVYAFVDAALNTIVVQLPRIFYGSGSPVAGGGNDEVTLSMEFTAIREQVTGGKTVHFDLIPGAMPA